MSSGIIEINTKPFFYVVSYIADHYAFDIPLERLASIACIL